MVTYHFYCAFQNSAMATFISEESPSLNKTFCTKLDACTDSYSAVQLQLLTVTCNLLLVIYLSVGQSTASFMEILIAGKFASI